VGAFPRPQRARVLWYGIDDHAGRLDELAGRVSSAAGLPEQDAFRPHLTLARSRNDQGSDARPLLAAARPPRASLPVTELVLYRSHLGSGPPRYEALRRVALGAAVTA
jgi:2'-5' RNA ligase